MIKQFAKNKVFRFMLWMARKTQEEKSLICIRGINIVEFNLMWEIMFFSILFSQRNRSLAVRLLSWSMCVLSLLLGIAWLFVKPLLFYSFENVSFAHMVMNNTEFTVINVYCFYPFSFSALFWLTPFLISSDEHLILLNIIVFWL